MTTLRHLSALLRMIALMATGLWFHPVLPAAAEEMNFITRRGDQLFDGDKEFRFISFNIPNLMVIEDAYEFTKPNPWRWPNEFELEDALESVRQMGGQVVRTYVISVYRDGSDMGDVVHVRRPGEFNEEGFRALDKLIEIAKQKGIRVVIPFVDKSKWWGGIGEYAAFRGKPPEAFWTDRQIIEDFKATVRHLINRKNVYTGVAYRDEPTILGWQTGNEIDSPAEWTREISAYLKELAPKHLVIEGKSLNGVPKWSLEDPNVDVITTHHYPFGLDHDYVEEIQAAHALTKGKKAYFIGEFGFVETPHIQTAIDTVIKDGISGALIWSLRMHRREGGFYWHMEVGTGRNIYKAYHWPGFASGDRYDERQIMKLMREKAFEIRGIEPPPIEAPASPELLPIERVSAISWQGSAGAASYEVWRSEGESGDWKKIADDVSDADVQYRPLFNDESAVPGRSYSYRVVAKNSAGASEPSNVVGPVGARCRTLVDECRDLALTTATSGDVKLSTENARTVQEDCHRFALRPGSSVTYRVGGPIDRWRVFSFGKDQGDALEFAVSSDGKKFESTEARGQVFASGQTVYGYLTPVLYEGEVRNKSARYLRVSMSANPSGSDDKDAAPVEIGRIEVEYDGVTRDAAQRDEPVKPTPASAAIFIDNPQFISSALESIDKAAERGDRRLNVVVTILVDLTKDFHIKSYGWASDPDREYEPATETMHKELQDALRQVFTRMVKHNMDIFILPHIDPGGEVRTWRNWVDFDPLEQHGGYTYEQLMIDTIADALAETAPADRHVEMALSGEMGRSLFLYPQSYRKIVQRLRERDDLKNLKIGISLNHGGIAGRGNPSGAPDTQLTDKTRPQMQALIDECDFVGMSFYRPVSLPPTRDDFIVGIDHFMGEFAQHGLSVPVTKPMHFSEVGIGGGQAREGNERELKRAVDEPWQGSGFVGFNPWQPAAMQKLRREYHNALLEFLTDQPARWHVSAAFFWSQGSWDPQGMRNPVFADAEIVKTIETHNRKAESRAVGK